jgi:NADPH:quinone reductase
MRAVRLHAFGPAENLRYEAVDDPEPGSGQVRIAVAAAGVHLIDTTIRAGERMGPYPLPELPAIPGREVAGVVDAVGPEVDERWLGRRVAAHLGVASAGYAELAVREVEHLHELPDGVADDVAVAMIGTGRTTVGILDAGRIGAHDVVLVTAAAGGIGGLIVQAAHNAGATVAGLAGGAAKVERVRALGADVAVDYREPGWSDALREALGREVTVAFDGVGGEAGRTALELLGRGGRLVIFGLSSGELTELSAGDVFSRGITVTSAVGGPDGMRERQERALAAAAARDWVPLLTRFPLTDAAAAHAALESRQTVGKVVLVP